MATLQVSASTVQSPSPWGLGSFESGGSSGSRSGSPMQQSSPKKVNLPTMAAVTVLQPVFPDEEHAQPIFGMLTDHLDQMVRISTWPALRLPFNIEYGTVLTLRLFRTPPNSTEGFSEFDFVAGLQVPVGKLLAMGNSLQCWCSLSADIGTLVADFDDRAGAALEAFKTVRQRATYEICPKVFIALRPVRQDHVSRPLKTGDGTDSTLCVSGSTSQSNMQLSPLSSVPGWGFSPLPSDALATTRVTPRRTRSNSPSATMQLVQAELSAEKQQLLKDISLLAEKAQQQRVVSRELTARAKSDPKEDHHLQGHRELQQRLADLRQERPPPLMTPSVGSTAEATPHPSRSALAPTSVNALYEECRRMPAEDENRQNNVLRCELRAERDRFKALQQSTNVEQHGVNCAMSELYEMLEAERAAVSHWQEDCLEAELSRCNDRAHWCERVDKLKSELAHFEREEADSAVAKQLEFHFDELHSDKIGQVDHEMFKNEFVLSLGMLGVTPALLGRLNICVRAGSVIVGVIGPASAVNALKRLLLVSQVTVMGSAARVEEALQDGHAEQLDLKQRAEVLSQECEVLKGRRLYEDLYVRHEALTQEHEALQTQCLESVNLTEHEALRCLHEQLEEEHEAHKAEHFGMAASDFAALQKRLETLSGALEALEKECSRRVDGAEHETLQQEYQALRREHEDLRTVALQQMAASTENEELKERCDCLQQEIDELKAKFALTVEADRHADMERRYTALSQEHEELAQEHGNLKELKRQLSSSADANAVRAQQEFEDLQRGCQALETKLQTLQQAHATELQALQEKHASVNLKLQQANESVPRSIELSQESFEASHAKMRETFLEELQVAEKAHSIKMSQELETAQKQYDHALDSVRKTHSRSLDESERCWEQAERALERRWAAELHEECTHAATAVVAADTAGSARATSALQGRVEMLKGEVKDFQEALQQEKQRSILEVKEAESGAAAAAAEELTLARQAMESMEGQILASQIPAARSLLSTIEEQEANHAATHHELRELMEAEAHDDRKREEVDSVRAQILGTIENRVQVLQDEVMRERDLYGYHAGHGAMLEAQFEQLRTYTEEREQQLHELQALCTGNQEQRQAGDAILLAQLRDEAAQAYSLEKQMRDAHVGLLNEYQVAEAMIAAQERVQSDSRQELAVAEAEVRLLRQELLEPQGARHTVHRQRAADAEKGLPSIHRTPSFEIIHGDVFEHEAILDSEGAEVVAAHSATSSRPSTPHTPHTPGGGSQFRPSPSSASSVSGTSGVDGGHSNRSQVSNGTGLLALPAGPSSEEARTVCVTWSIEIDRSGGDALGIDLHGASLQIDSILEGGLFSRWNKANPFQAVCAGDRICAVNSRQGSQDIIAEMQDYKQLHITMVRNTPADEEGKAFSPTSPSKAKIVSPTATTEALVVQKFVSGSMDPGALSLDVGTTVKIVATAGAWATVKTPTGQTGEVPVVCLQKEAATPLPDAEVRLTKPAQPPSASARRTAQPAARSGRASDPAQILSKGGSSDERKPRPSIGNVSSTSSREIRIQRRDSEHVVPKQRLSLSQGIVTNPKLPSTSTLKSATPPSVEKKRSGSLSRSGSGMSIGSASDQRSGTVRPTSKSKASAKAATERKGVDVFMASLRG